MKITTILPISRTTFLERVIKSLENQTYKIKNLIVIFDGEDRDYIQVRNRIVELEFENVLCVPSQHTATAHSIPDRRRHIVNIHNQFKTLIGEADWIFSIEDDGILPEDALEKLVIATKDRPDTGMITGVELGRWGVPYVGAWVVDDIEITKSVTSIDNKAGDEVVDKIDACGLYCALIRADLYKQHEFFTYNGLGPDVNLGLFLRQQGLQNYIHWGVPVTHITIFYGTEKHIPANSNSRVVKLKLLSGNTWQASH